MKQSSGSDTLAVVVCMRPDARPDGRPKFPFSKTMKTMKTKIRLNASFFLIVNGLLFFGPCLMKHQVKVKNTNFLNNFFFKAAFYFVNG
jgi:hypothetical protein